MNDEGKKMIEDAERLSLSPSDPLFGAFARTATRYLLPIAHRLAARLRAVLEELEEAREVNGMNVRVSTEAQERCFELRVKSGGDEAPDPNAPIPLCRPCAERHHEEMDAAWQEYRSGQM